MSIKRGGKEKEEEEEGYFSLSVRKHLLTIHFFIFFLRKLSYTTCALSRIFFLGLCSYGEKYPLCETFNFFLYLYWFFFVSRLPLSWELRDFFFLHSYDKMHKVSAKPLEPSAPGFYNLKEIEPEQLLGWIGRFNPKILCWKHSGS